MYNYTWVIINSVLSIKGPDNLIITPSAKDIFQFIFKNGQTIEDFSMPRIEMEVPGLSFSRFPLELGFIVENRNTGGEMGIYCYIAGFRGKSIIKFDINTHQLHDHVVIDNVWYPFVQGARDEILRILEEAGITSTGRVTLRQYMSLKKTVAKYSVKIKDAVKFHNKLKHESISLPEDILGFTGKLYPYQKQGYQWLKMIAGEDAGCILADEMGLGKTIQIIALLSCETAAGRKPSLVVAPSTVLENWRREIINFAPGMNVLVHQGANRTGFHSELRKRDIVLSSYETVLRDLSMFGMINWNIVVVDEAQAIKNPHAKRTLALKQLPRRVAIAVTGTPLENHVTDLWSVTDFAFPGFLGSLSSFESTYSDDLETAEKLEPLVSPILLRRRVKDVAGDLPERIDIPQIIELDEKSAKEYESIRQEIVAEYGNRATFVALAKLRMFCTHPFLLGKLYGDPTRYSNKYVRLVEILEEIFDNGEKVLIFTSYTRMTDIFLKDLRERFGIPCNWIDGRVPVNERQEKIDEFSNVNGPAVLILNPRAAGAGLNITAANHVIHYNLEWNPALEDQASARAYRRGQTRPVTVHRLFYANTVEEVISQRVDIKRMLQEVAIVGTDGKFDGRSDILEALKKSPLLGR